MGRTSSSARLRARGPSPTCGGSRLATNGTGSYSGYHVWRHMLPAGDDPPSFFGEVVASGVPSCQSSARVAAGARGRVRGRLRHPRAGFRQCPRGVARHPDPGVVADRAGHAFRDRGRDIGRGRRKDARRAPCCDSRPVACARAQRTSPHRRERSDRRRLPECVPGLASVGGVVSAGRGRSPGARACGPDRRCSMKRESRMKK